MSERALLFDIQKCSVTDGPGIRTVVFFKGCGLRCRWCHNPESQQSRPELLFHRERCTGCGSCRRVCPHALASCELCGRCTLYCPARARELAGRLWTVDEIMEQILGDLPFYETSGGGATFSGGECLLQPDVLLALLRRCRRDGIHTAVDTAGAAPWAVFERILPFTDLFLYDLKCVTEPLHVAGTGATNTEIIANLRKLAARAADRIRIRIPMIPGFNTGREELVKMRELLRELGLTAVDVLPYHRMGEGKYAALGREAVRYPVPEKDEVERWRAFFAE